MIRNVLLLAVLLGVNIPSILKEQSLLEHQLQYERVQNAVQSYDESWESLCASKGLSYPPKNLFIRVFKQERVVEIWGSDEENQYISIKDFPICAISGGPGPKRKEGDKQIPEGIYNVELFNPVSKFHLSVKIDYPNRADKALGHKMYPGGNIFFHGGCKTIGCIPLTNELVKEFYTIVLNAYSNSEDIPVHIFPFRMENNQLESAVSKFPEHQDFWNELLPIYDHFEREKMIPVVRINKDGAYEL